MNQELTENIETVSEIPNVHKSDVNIVETPNETEVISVDASPPGGLGRRIPKDMSHIERNHIRALGRGIVENVEKTLVLPSWHTKHDQGEEGACFLAGTLITMSDGTTLPIENIRTFDKVVDKNGKIGCSVLETFLNWYDGDIVNVCLWGNNALKCTANHRIFTQRGYVEAKNLRTDDLVKIPKYQIHINEEITLDSYLTNEELKSVKNPISTKCFPLTYGFGRILGLYAAEGCCLTNSSNYRVSWSLSEDEENTLGKEIIEFLDSINASWYIGRKKNSKSITINSSKKDLALFFSRIIPGKCYNKHLTSELTQANIEFKRGLVDGLVDGDGHRRRNTTSIVTTSHQLALDIFNIGNALGLRPIINWSNPSMNKWAKTRRIRWVVEYPTTSIKQTHYRNEEDDNFIWRRVRSIKTSEYSGFVYNLHVDGDNSYIAEGISVSNCVGHGVSMMLSIVNEHQVRRQGQKNPYIRYNAWWLWKKAKEIDEWPETTPEDSQGTSVKAACEVLINLGHVIWENEDDPNSISDVASDYGISAVRWATQVDEIRTAINSNQPVAFGSNWYSKMDSPEYIDGEWWIGKNNQIGYLRGGHCVCLYGASDSRQAFRLKNSWGSRYPEVWIPYDLVDRLLKEQAECSLITDK